MSIARLAPRYRWIRRVFRPGGGGRGEGVICPEGEARVFHRAEAGGPVVLQIRPFHERRRGVPSRRRPRVSEKATTNSATLCPGTPFDFANAAGPGASSSSDEAAAQGLGGGGGPSSSHLGHGSSSKRTRTDLAAGEAHAVAVRIEEQKIKEDYRDEKGHLLFDLNEAWAGN
ncbi:hypothetical protein ZWY2020_036720 [Hordeum vulgare]|nr:hypothetical protein ZWY2020_036720 [Hordeum vulgare]